MNIVLDAAKLTLGSMALGAGIGVLTHLSGSSAPAEFLALPASDNIYPPGPAEDETLYLPSPSIRAELLPTCPAQNLDIIPSFLQNISSVKTQTCLVPIEDRERYALVEYDPDQLALVPIYTTEGDSDYTVAIELGYACIIGADIVYKFAKDKAKNEDYSIEGILNKWKKSDRVNLYDYTKAAERIEAFLDSADTSLSLDRFSLSSLPPIFDHPDFPTSRLKTLSLKGNQFSELPPQILKLDCLESLNLSRNPLTWLPPEICNLSKLSSLSLEKTGIISLPKNIGQLTQLTRLNLTSVYLSSIPTGTISMILPLLSRTQIAHLITYSSQVRLELTGYIEEQLKSETPTLHPKVLLALFNYYEAQNLENQNITGEHNKVREVISRIPLNLIRHAIEQLKSGDFMVQLYSYLYSIPKWSVGQAELALFAFSFSGQRMPIDGPKLVSKLAQFTQAQFHEIIQSFCSEGCDEEIWRTLLSSDIFNSPLVSKSDYNRLTDYFLNMLMGLKALPNASTAALFSSFLSQAAIEDTFLSSPALQAKISELFEQTDWEVFKALPLQSLKVWCPDFDPNVSLSEDLRVFIPSIPIHDAPLTSREGLETFLNSKAFPEPIKQTALSTWDKAAYPSQQLFQSTMRQHFSKIIQLSEQDRISDEQIRIFFSNIQGEHLVCWPGMLSKIKDAFRTLTLHVSGGAIPSSLTAPTDLTSLKSIIERATVGYSEEAYHELQGVLKKFEKEIRDFANHLIETAEIADPQAEMEAFIATCAQVIQKELPQEARDELRDTFFEGNSQHIKIALALASSKEALSLTELTLKASLPDYASFITQKVLKELIGWHIETETGTYALNKESPKVLKFLKSLSQIETKEVKKENLGPALKYAVKEGAESHPKMLEAESKADFHALKLTLIKQSNTALQALLDAHKYELIIKLVEPLLRDDQRIKFKPTFSAEQIVNYFYNNCNQCVRQDEATLILAYSILGVGNQVHVLKAITQFLSANLGLDPRAAEGDQYAQRVLEHIVTNPNITDLTLIGEFEDKIGSTVSESIQDMLNGTANNPSEHIDHLGLFKAELNKAYGAKFGTEKLFQIAFTPETEEKKERITLHGVLLLTRAFNLIQSVPIV